MLIVVRINYVQPIEKSVGLPPNPKVGAPHFYSDWGSAGQPMFIPGT